MSTTYETDFYAWANEQAALLRTGRLDAADIENIAEEIESMGRSEKRELINRLSTLMLHLLKWHSQTNRRGKSWQLTIDEQRERLTEHLNDNPSLKATLGASMLTAYRLAVFGAAQETGFDRAVFPETCPWSFSQIMSEEFWPD